VLHELSLSIEMQEFEIDPALNTLHKCDIVHAVFRTFPELNEQGPWKLFEVFFWGGG
jgi:hypothetical protein